MSASDVNWIHIHGHACFWNLALEMRVLAIYLVLANRPDIADLTPPEVPFNDGTRR